MRLKEISYIHAEDYAAGELKHDPVALIDRDMPVLALLLAYEIAVLRGCDVDQPRNLAKSVTVE